MISRLFIAVLWSPAGKGLTSWLLFVMFNCVFDTFPCGILGQVWYLMVSITDLCRISYYERPWGSPTIYDKWTSGWSNSLHSNDQARIQSRVTFGSPTKLPCGPWVAVLHGFKYGDNCIQNLHLGRYNVGYTVRNLVLRRGVSGAVKRDFRTYIRRYTSPNENFEYEYPHSNALLTFPFKNTVEM